MKTYCYLLFCLTAALFACDDDNKRSPLSLEYPAEPIASEGGSISMTIRAAGRWTISKTTSWLTVAPAAGTGEQTITISAPSNMVERKDTPNRKTRIYIIAGEFTETLDIVQSGYSQPTSPAPQVSKTQTDCMASITIAEPVEHAVAYRWYCDSVEVLTDTALTFEVLESGTHSYAAAGVNITGHTGEWSEPVEINMIICPPPQEVTSHITGAEANSCSAKVGKNTVTLTAPKISFATSYLWYLDGVLVDSGASKTFAAKSSGTYTVKGANVEGVSGESPGKTVTITPCPLTIDDLIGSWQAHGYYYRSSAYNPISHTTLISKTGVTQIRIQDFLKLADTWSSGVNDYTATVDAVDADTLTITIPAASKAGDGIYTGSASTIIVGYVDGTSCNNRDKAIIGKLMRNNDELILDFSIYSRSATTIEDKELYPCSMLLGITSSDGCVGGGYYTYGLKFTKPY
jgi:hypothetical protein